MLVISEPCNKGTILQRNYRKMTTVIFLKFLCTIPFISLILGFKGMDRVISDSYNKGKILQRNYIHGHFPIIPL